MSAYILDVNVLQKGDIILIRDDSNESKRIREASKSEYHHAMIYRSEYSYIESDGTGVQAKISNVNYLSISRMQLCYAL
jgi:cell wall-associated NlpC family hydrolase